MLVEADLLLASGDLKERQIKSSLPGKDERLIYANLRTEAQLFQVSVKLTFRHYPNVLYLDHAFAVHKEG